MPVRLRAAPPETLPPAQCYPGPLTWDSPMDTSNWSGCRIYGLMIGIATGKPLPCGRREIYMPNLGDSKAVLNHSNCQWTILLKSVTRRDIVDVRQAMVFY